MLRGKCTPKLSRPRIIQPRLEATAEEKEHAKRWAFELARIVMRAAEEGGAAHDPCSMVGRARKRLDAMSTKGRLVALKSAKKLADAQTRGCATDTDVDPDLRTLTRTLGRKRLEALRPEIRSAIKMVVAQVNDRKLSFPRTTVQMRPAGEIHPTPTSHSCSDTPPKLTFNWESSEPMAARAYWELRGPLVNGYPGKFLARGYSENILPAGRVGGEFTINLLNYLGPQSPDPTERYYVHVLPLAAPSERAVVGMEVSPGFKVFGQTFDPAPPVGVGPWSTPAVIDIGRECRSPGTHFDIETVDYYRKARVKVNWFKVHSDQTGPGDEEYHLRAIMIEHTPLGSTSIGNFGSYLPVNEGDNSKHPLGWKSYIRDLGQPITNMWPRLFVVALSVLEEDGGDELDEWSEALAELAREALEGDLADEVQDFLRDLRDELEEATTAFHAELASETAAYIGALVASSALGAVAAIVAFAAGLIGIFANSGARDDVYGVEVLTLALVTNNAARMRDGTAGSIQASRLSSGGSFSGSEQNGRFELDEIVLQLIDKGGPDEAGLGGSVQLGLGFEFYDKATGYY
jgi:hypothetical protein